MVRRNTFVQCSALQKTQFGAEEAALTELRVAGGVTRPSKMRDRAGAITLLVSKSQPNDRCDIGTDPLRGPHAALTAS
jgi:hypothetical protein